MLSTDNVCEHVSPVSRGRTVSAQASRADAGWVGRDEIVILLLDSGTRGAIPKKVSPNDQFDQMSVGLLERLERQEPFSDDHVIGDTYLARQAKNANRVRSVPRKGRVNLTQTLGHANGDHHAVTLFRREVSMATLALD